MKGRVIAIALVVLGVGGGVLGIWYMRRARPTAGDYYEVFAIDRDHAVALRHEVGSKNSFLELVDAHDGVKWQALIPEYAGRPDAPGVAASPQAITVRVRRDGRDEVWALSTEDADKLGSLPLDPGSARDGGGPPAVVTVSDARQSFELTGDAGHTSTVTAIQLADGRAMWRVDLGPLPGGVAGAALDDRALWLRLGDHTVRGLDRQTGRPAADPPAALPPPRDPHVAPDGTRWVVAADHVAPAATAKRE